MASIPPTISLPAALATLVVAGLHLLDRTLIGFGGDSVFCVQFAQPGQFLPVALRFGARLLKNPLPLAAHLLLRPVKLLRGASRLLDRGFVQAEFARQPRHGLQGLRFVGGQFVGNFAGHENLSNSGSREA
jgi:hypothetical protein